MEHVRISCVLSPDPDSTRICAHLDLPQKCWSVKWPFLHVGDTDTQSPEAQQNHSEIAQQIWAYFHAVIEKLRAHLGEDSCLMHHRSMRHIKIGPTTFCSWSNTSSTIPADHMFWMTLSYFTCYSGPWVIWWFNLRNRIAASFSLFCRCDDAPWHQGNLPSYRPSTKSKEFSNSCNTGSIADSKSSEIIPTDSSSQKDMTVSSQTFTHNSWCDTLWWDADLPEDQQQNIIQLNTEFCAMR